MASCRYRPILAIFALLLVSICALSQSGPPPARLLVLPPNPLLVLPSSDQQFSANTGFFTALGQPLSHSSVVGKATWSSSNTLVATVNPVTGMAHPIAKGVTTITARRGGFFGSTQLVVSSAALQSIAVTTSGPANPTQCNGAPCIPKGTHQQYIATATFVDSSTANVTNTATWTSANTTKVQMQMPFGNKGLAYGAGQTVVGLNNNPVTITAALNGIQGTTTLVVGPPALVRINITAAGSSTIQLGNTLQLTATGLWTDGSTTDFTQSAGTLWTSSNPAVA